MIYIGNFLLINQILIPPEILTRIARYIDQPTKLSAVCKVFKQVVSDPKYLMSEVTQVFQEKYGLSERELQLLMFSEGLGSDNKVAIVLQQLQSAEQFLFSRPPALHPPHCLSIYAKYVQEKYSAPDPTGNRVEEFSSFDPFLPLQNVLRLQYALVNFNREGLGSCLISASSNNCLTIVQTILDHPRSVEIPRNKFGDALCQACMDGHIKIVQALLNHSRSHKIPRTTFGHALYDACAEGHLKIVEELLKHPLSHKIFGGDGGMGESLVIAIEGGHLEIAKTLLAHPRSSQIPAGEDGIGQGLVRASSKGYLEIVLMLLNHPRSHEIPAGEWGMGEALKNALEGGYFEIAHEILNHPKSREIPNSNEWGIEGVLDIASIKGGLDVVNRVLNDRGNEISGEAMGEALFDASSRGYKEIVKVLLEHPKSSEIPDVGECSLMEAQFAAAQNGHVEVVKLFLHYFGNYELVDEPPAKRLKT